MKTGYKVIRAFFFLLFILVCGGLTQFGNRLLMKPVLAIVTGSANEQSPKATPDPKKNNPNLQTGERPVQTGAKPSQSNTLENASVKTLIEQILNHQSQEGNAILEEETRLRLQEIRERLDRFGQDRKQAMDNALKIKNESLKQELARSLEEKAALNQTALRQFELDLEESQKVNLVNIRLKLVAISLDRKNNSFNEEEQELNDRIEQIRQEISRKVETKKTRLSEDFRVFEAAARQTGDKEFAEYKATLEEALQKEYSALKAGLEKELQTWRENQKKNLDDAIRLRKNKMQSQTAT